MSFFKQSLLKPRLETPLYQQLYEHLRQEILSGGLKRGTKLPSTRALAEELGVSRNTILNAYDQLLAEGYLESVEGSGTFVSRVLPELFLVAPAVNKPDQPESRQPRLSKNTQQVMAAPRMPRPTLDQRGQILRAFRAGTPALDQFPFEIWSRLLGRHTRYLNASAMRYQDDAGYRPLREAIAHHVTLSRQVRCTPDQVIIVAGSQGALDLAARVLLNPDDAVWVEDPGYLGARGALQAVGAHIIPVPVDDDGLMVETGIERAPDARLVYLTPSHQFPLGVTLSLARRLALLDWAKRASAYILEDDYDSEYRYSGRPLASLQGLDDGERVLYIGTFSKVLFPALRLGYIIVPPSLVEAFWAMRAFIDIHPPILEQMALADFIAEGHFVRHLRRMRTLYAERRALLLDALKNLPLEVSGAAAGMHFVGWLPDGLEDLAVSEKAAAHQVHAMPVSYFRIKPGGRQGLIFGYASVDEREIQRGAPRLAATFKEFNL